MPDQSTILSLPHILPSQAQKHVTHNEALRLLDVIVQLTVLQRTLTAPPVSPVLGDRYIVAPSPTGDWSGRGRDIALWNGTAWEFFNALQGWRAYVVAEAAIVIFDGTNWEIPSGGVAEFGQLGVNMAADATNRLAVDSAAALFTNPGGSHQLAINKGSNTATGSVLFQQGYLTRAEVGLIATNDLSVKVSPDGTTFYPAITVNKDNGRASMEQPMRLTPAASDPAAPADGFLWYNSTTGKFRGRQAGATIDLVAAGAVSVFSDASFRIEDDLDSTKKAVFQTAGITTGTTRTYDLPNTSGVIALLSGTQAFTGPTSFSSTADFTGTTTISAATVSLGTSALASTVGLGTGATTSGVSKTVNIGTAGLLGSTTTVNVGSAVVGSLGTINMNDATVFSSTIAVNGAATFSGTADFSGTTTVSAPTASIGTSAAASTVGVGTGATTTGVTKTLNLGTAGLIGSTTTVNIGSAVVGALGVINMNEPVVFASTANVAGAATFSGTADFSGTTTVSAPTASIGTSAAASTVGVGTGATTTGVTKIVNLGTAGQSGSTTNVNIGSGVGGALGATTVSSPTLTVQSTTVAMPNATSVAMAAATVSASRLGLGGATADATNRLSVTAPGVLFNNAGNGIEATLNKAAPSDNARMTFMTGFSTRAQFGTSGTDDFSLRVSADGALFNDGLSVAAATGSVSLAKPVILTGQSADPGAPSDGTLWYNSTSGQLKSRVGGETIAIDGQRDVPFLLPIAGEYVIASMGAGTTLGTVAGLAGRVDMFPFVARANFTVTGIALNCTTAVAAALAKFAVYSSDANGRPNARLLETADVDLSTVGAKTAAASLAMVAGRTYWLALRTSSTATISNFGLNATPDINGGTPSVSARKLLRRTIAYGTAAPATWGFLSSEISNFAAPAIWLQV